MVLCRLLVIIDNTPVFIFAILIKKVSHLRCFLTI